MRLNRYLAACGLGSRRSCEDLIRLGRVRINGETARLGAPVVAGDCVTVDGKEVSLQQRGGVWMLHKPAGVVCTARDPQGRPTVLTLARRQGIGQRLFPVGRLDRDTTGLLLLTDDGELAFRLTHPSWGIEKEYEARIGRLLRQEELQQLQQGIDLEDGPTLPCRASQERQGEEILLRLVLQEGRKRQIRRMLQSLGVPLQHLHRGRLGPLRLGDLPLGQLRLLTPEEVATLRRSLMAGKSRGRDEPPSWA